MEKVYQSYIAITKVIKLELCMLWDIFSTQLACCDIYLILQLRKQASVQKTRRGLCIELTMHFCLGLEHEVLKTTSELCEAGLCSCLLSEAASLDLITVIVANRLPCAFLWISHHFSTQAGTTRLILILVLLLFPEVISVRPRKEAQAFLVASEDKCY